MTGDGPAPGSRADGPCLSAAVPEALSGAGSPLTGSGTLAAVAARASLTVSGMSAPPVGEGFRGSDGTADT